ncbi:type II toxin-antitoxin system YoeB family toxin [Nocardia carnea]|uniref:type II toxin-antitoxin system YoeB family toxin n=1 Tax=Nocardia carnea TaxID=37328 RepID=UPI003D77DE19
MATLSRSITTPPESRLQLPARSASTLRRITQEHRLVYRGEDEVIHLLSCRHHYG